MTVGKLDLNPGRKYLGGHEEERLRPLTGDWAMHGVMAGLGKKDASVPCLGMAAQTQDHFLGA